MSIVDWDQLRANGLAFLQQHYRGDASDWDAASVTGDFALRRDLQERDLYGLCDAVYLLTYLDLLEEVTSAASRAEWASRILAFQGHDGWFGSDNERGHGAEHATAYAVGSLRMLGLSEPVAFTSQVRPISGWIPVWTDSRVAVDWIERLGWRGPGGIVHKDLGWHYVWRGSHVAGACAATLGMLEQSATWSGGIDRAAWLDWFLTWLDNAQNPRSGLWQRAFWNVIVRRPLTLDLGGAAHFLWIYEKVGRPPLHSAALVQSVLLLQKESGLFKRTPFCIDFDGVHALSVAWQGMTPQERERWSGPVQVAVERSLRAIGSRLSSTPWGEVYSDLHGPPGAVAAVLEASWLTATLADASPAAEHCRPLSSVWWL